MLPLVPGGTRRAKSPSHNARGSPPGSKDELNRGGLFFDRWIMGLDPPATGFDSRPSRHRTRTNVFLERSPCAEPRATNTSGSMDQQQAV